MHLARRGGNMIKAKVLKPFYIKENSILYLDEERFKELEKTSVVEAVEDEYIETTQLVVDGTRKILSKQGMEKR